MHTWYDRFRLRRARRLEEWDAICDRCGLCCYQKKYLHHRLVIDLSSPCPYLDESTRQCRVYENRFRVCLDCRRVTRYHALFSGLMPADCAYVRKYRKFRKLVRPPLIYNTRDRRTS
jgi:uncharacterized protein